MEPYGQLRVGRGIRQSLRDCLCRLQDTEAHTQAQRLLLPRDCTAQRGRMNASSIQSEATMPSISIVLARLLGRSIPILIVAWLQIEPALAQQQPTSEILEYQGIVAAAREAEVAPRLDGLLSKINFKAGQLVQKGDLLFEFASKDKELSLTLAQATLKQIEAQLR